MLMTEKNTSMQRTGFTSLFLALILGLLVLAESNVFAESAQNLVLANRLAQRLAISAPASVVSQMATDIGAGR